MRSKSFIKNLIAQIAYEAVIAILSIVMPKAIIMTYGSPVNGLSSGITQILLLINLIQAGAAGATIYALYKPVQNKDYKELSEILYSSKRYFRKLGIIYCIIASGVAVYASFTLAGEGISSLQVLIAFLLLAASSAFSFFSFSHYDIILSSFHKRYLLTAGNFVEKAIYYILLTLILVGKANFLLMYVAVLIGAIGKTIFYKILYNRQFATIIDKNPINKNHPIHGRGYLLLTSVSEQALVSSPTVIVTKNFGFSVTSVYSVYGIVVSAVSTLINAVQISMSAIFGNLTAAENSEKIKKVYDVILLVFLCLGIYLGSCIGFLIEPFILLFSKNITDANYIYKTLCYLITVYSVVFALKTPYGFASTVYGLFKSISKITVIVGAFSIILSSSMSYFFGMPYVFVGVLFYHIISAICIIYTMNEKIEWFRFKLKISRVILLALPVISICLSVYSCSFINSWMIWLITAVVYSFIIGILLVVYCLIFEKSESEMLITYIKAIISR